MNPNKLQAIDNEEEGEQESEEDIDWAQVYGGIDVAEDEPLSKDLKDSYSDIFKDVAKQGVKEFLIGAGGAYGDLFELAGLNKESEADKARYSREFETLEKMRDPDYQPTFQDLSSLSDDSDIQSSFRLPTSESLRELNEGLGGPGKAETEAGRYAGRAAKLYGAGVAFGQFNPLPAAAGGGAGQFVEEQGGGPLLQAAAEIAAMVLTPQGGLKRLITSDKKKVQEMISKLRGLGYAEEDITLAVNAAYKKAKSPKVASKGQATEQAFEDFSQHSDDIVNNILSSEIPGIESGTQKVHQMASDAYGQVAKEGAALTITNSKPFLDSAKKVVDQLQNTLGKNPEAQAFIKRISEAAMDATQFPSAEKMMNFYKELNSMGNWLGRSHKDKLINQMKNGIKDTFKGQGKKGTELAEKFEKANAGIRKAYQAEDLHNLIQKVSTADGIDYKKFSKLFDKPDNIELFKDVLGATQTKNLNLIGKVGSQVKDFDKSWKAANAFRLSTADLVRGGAASYYIYKGDWEGLAKVAATKIGTAGIRRIAEKAITDPKMQNILIKGLHAVKVESPKLMKSANEAMKNYLMEQGIDLDDIESESNP